MPLASHCPDCGAEVQSCGPSTGACTACGREVYANAKPTAGVLLVREGRVLLVRRGAEPGMGRWDIPGGFLEENETPEDGAVREIREELGLDLEARDLKLVSTSLNVLPGGTALDVLFEASGVAGRGTERRAGSDAAACARNRERFGLTMPELIDPDGVFRARFEVAASDVNIVTRRGVVTWWSRFGDAFVELAIQQAFAP